MKDCIKHLMLFCSALVLSTANLYAYKIIIKKKNLIWTYAQFDRDVSFSQNIKNHMLSAGVPSPYSTPYWPQISATGTGTISLRLISNKFKGTDYPTGITVYGFKYNAGTRVFSNLEDYDIVNDGARTLITPSSFMAEVFVRSDATNLRNRPTGGRLLIGSNPLSPTEGMANYGNSDRPLPQGLRRVNVNVGDIEMQPLSDPISINQDMPVRRPIPTRESIGLGPRAIGPVASSSTRVVRFLTFGSSTKVFLVTTLTGLASVTIGYSVYQHIVLPDGSTVNKPIEEAHPDETLSYEIEIEGDVSINSIKIPGIAPITNFNKGVKVTVTNTAGARTVKEFSIVNRSNASNIDDNKIEFLQTAPNGSDMVVRTTAGDKVEYELFGFDSDEEPILKGIPKIFPVTFAAQRQFLCVPDYGPNQYSPWWAFEAQTHFRQINSYPKNPFFQIKSDPWETDATTNTKKWTWYAQRETDPAITKYLPDVYYPKVRSDQRESQAVGWAAQFLHFYNMYEKDPTDPRIPKYITGFDIDDWLIPTANNALTAFNYPNGETSGRAVKNQNWQKLWDEESKEALIAAGRIKPGDIVTNDVLGGVVYPQVWDGTTGFPKAGFVSNDMITAYQKYKVKTDGDPTTNLPDDYYFNAYEIEDKGTNYINNGRTPSIKPAGSAVVRNTTANLPGACAIGCWSNDAYSTGNTKHPGIVTVVFDATENPFTITFRQEVKNPIKDPVTNPTAGFFGSLKGDQWPMGYGNKTTYTLKGVQSVEDAKRISLSMLEYDNGAMIPATTRNYIAGNTNPEKGLVYNATNKELSATFQVYSGWMAIAAFLKSVDGLDSVIIAGRVPMVMDPLSSITIPGQEPLPYDDKPLNAEVSTSYWSRFTNYFFQDYVTMTDATNLAEGQGDRSWELMNEFRKTKDIGRGFDFRNGDGYSEGFPREYVLQKGVSTTFACIGPGRKIQSFWSQEGAEKKEDPYQSNRELAKRMPQDIVAERVKWYVYKVDEETNERNLVIGPVLTRHFSYTFTEEGEYYVQQLFNGDKDNPTKVRIVVKNFPNIVVSPDLQNLKKSVERGEIEVSLLKEDERGWLRNFNPSVSESVLDNLRVVKVSNISSYYTYTKGPRANNYTHREGAYNDFNNRFKWYLAGNTFVAPESFQPENGTIYTDVTPRLVNHIAAQPFINTFIPESVWPAAWKGIYVNHVPGKAESSQLPVPPYTKTFDGDDNPTNLSRLNTLLDGAHNSLSESQSVLDWLRWYPWIAKSPSKGYKFNRYVKTTLKLKDFFANGAAVGSGAVFTGKAAIEMGNISNAVASMDWYDYGSPEAQQPSAQELERHMHDSVKNMLDFYHDLKAGRVIILDASSISNKKLIVTNENPRDASTPSGLMEINKNLPRHDIFIASAKVPPNEIANTVTQVDGIPLLTFDGARADTMNDLNERYFIKVIQGGSVSPLKYKLQHNGYDRFLKFDVPLQRATYADGQTIELKIVIPTKMALSGEIYGVALDVFAKNLSDEGFTFTEYFLEGKYNEQPSGLQNASLGASQTLLGDGLNTYTFRTSYSIEAKEIILRFKRSGGINNVPVDIRIDNIRLLKATSAPAFVKPNFISSDDAIVSNSFKWLLNSVDRFFDWNYENLNTEEGVFFETGPVKTGKDRKVSISGLGMGIAATILSKERGFITAATAQSRILNVLRWIDRLGSGTSNPATDPLFNGVKGWHGMPSHYYKKDKSLLGDDVINLETGRPFSKLDISTVDWAICAQGIRLARQYYSTDPQIVSISSRLLKRVDWGKFIVPEKHPETNKVIYQNLKGNLIYLGDRGYETQDKIDNAISAGLLTVLRNGGRVALNVNSETGIVPINGNAWGQTFTEEADLVYLEVMAANAEKKIHGTTKEKNEAIEMDISKLVYTDTRPYLDAAGLTQRMNVPHKILYREKKWDFFPNYKGSGFTYNWLQLWAGTNKIMSDNPSNTTADSRKTYYKDNSTVGYGHDYRTANAVFRKSYMGLTAASTVSDISPAGFVEYDDYLGEQGSDKNLSPAGEIIQVAPAPYGAVLSMPFLSGNEVKKSLQAYVDLGFYHEYMGLPDNIVIKNIGDKKILPNWEQKDINIAPIAMAFDQTNSKIISRNYLKDQYARAAYIILYKGIESDFNSTAVLPTDGPIAYVNLPKENADSVKAKFEANVYPNPTSGDIMVSLNIIKPGRYNASFIDVSGKPLYNVNWDCNRSGLFNFPIVALSSKGLGNGQYFLRITGPDGALIKPILIRK